MRGDGRGATEPEGHGVGEKFLLERQVFGESVEQQIEIGVACEGEVETASGCSVVDQTAASPGSTV